MNVTVLQGAEKTPVRGIINPERVDGARPHRDGGTLLEIGPDEVLVAEEFDDVAQELEEAWDSRGWPADAEAILEALRPVIPFLQLAVPFALAKISSQFGLPAGPAAALSIFPGAPMPDGPGPVPTGRPEDNGEGHEGTPAEGCEAAAKDLAGEVDGFCWNCKAPRPAGFACGQCGAAARRG